MGGGRPRTPTKVLKLRGAFKKHPERAAEREGEPDDERDIGGPPDRLNEAQRAWWMEFVNDAVPGVLRRSHRPAVELAARLAQRIIDNTDKGSELSVYSGLIGRLGFTPADQAKLKVPGRKAAANPFDEVTA